MIIIIECIGNFGAFNLFDVIFLNLNIILRLRVWFQNFDKDLPGRHSIVKVVIELIFVENLVNLSSFCLFYFICHKFDVVYVTEQTLNFQSINYYDFFVFH